MQLNSTVQFTLVGVLLVLVGFFLMLNSDVDIFDASTGRQVSDGLVICQDTPWVTVIGNGTYLHSEKEWHLQDLAQHLVADFYVQPFSVVNVRAEENIKHEAVVHLSDAIKERLPDTKFLWQSYTEKGVAK